MCVLFFEKVLKGGAQLVKFLVKMRAENDLFGWHGHARDKIGLSVWCLV